MKEGNRRWLRLLVCGALIGAGAILPGVSGGVLAVVFGIYRPFMEVLNDPRRALPRYWRGIPPLALGWVMGFLGFAKGIAAALDLSATVTTWLFIGLIAGSLPALFREAGKEGRGASAWWSFLLCGAAVFAGLYYVDRVLAVTVTPNFWWYNFCGVLWGPAHAGGAGPSGPAGAVGLPAGDAADHCAAGPGGGVAVPPFPLRGLSRHPGHRDSLHGDHRSHGLCRDG